MKVALLTTVDNPWNPWTHWDEWYAYDTRAGWNTPGLLARIATPSDGVSEDLNDEDLDAAMNTIIALHNGSIYKKVYSDDTVNIPPSMQNN